MAIEVAKYQFQPWARRGIAANIIEADTFAASNGATDERAEVPVSVNLNSQPIEKKFSLVGPCDLVGIQTDMIIRTEPKSLAADFEPNYLAFIEFYDEDFAWRYTPAANVGNRLRPWLALVVLKNDEYESMTRKNPLPCIKVTNTNTLPNLAESYWWAHVHTDQEIPVADISDLEQYLIELGNIVALDPDKIYCRLLCPRHLEATTNYGAFLVPAFEGGRLAGLDKPTAGIKAQQPAWTTGAGPVELPVYYQWSFRTGMNMDFEYLVKLLKPRPIDPRVGIRPMDCSKPGFVRLDSQGRVLSEDGVTPPKPAVQGLEGALQSPEMVPDPLVFQPNAFQQEVQVLANLPEILLDNPNEDPIVSIPLYGQNHARQKPTQKVLLDTTRSGWMHDLNRDPRTRTAAGLGTNVIQVNQEKLMQKAWAQVNNILAGNKLIRSTLLHMQVGKLLQTKYFAKFANTAFLNVTAQVHAKVLGSPTTIRHQVHESRLPNEIFGGTLRRIARPRGRLVKRLSSNGKNFNAGKLIEKINNQTIQLAPALPSPAGVPTEKDIVDNAISSLHLPAWLINLLRNRFGVLMIILAVLLGLALILTFTGIWIAGLVMVAAVVTTYSWLQRKRKLLNTTSALADSRTLLTTVEQLPPQPRFNIKYEGETTAPAPTPAPGGASADSLEAAKFRTAVQHLQTILAVALPVQVTRPAFSIQNAKEKVAQAIDPRAAFPKRLGKRIRFDNEPPISREEEITEAMTYPDFEDPMYAPLRDIDKQLLIPNLDLIPINTISLLRTNPRFIESYMVGLNHEFGRELLWREYPTDMRPSSFRQFWDIRGVQSPAKPEDAEKCKDITPIHGWQSTSNLGEHPGRISQNVKPGDKQVVLVVRGDLLKRYPHTVVYAQKAIGTKEHRKIKETDLTDEEFLTSIKFPQFKADVDPDIKLFGFDLTVEQAKGETVTMPFSDSLGWFFIIQEVPGNPRFGLDINYTRNKDADNNPIPDTWDNLAWDRFGGTPPAFVKPVPVPVMPNLSNLEKTAHPWAVDGAQMAYILFQKPVMVAVHASEMLNLKTE
jgi:hypothetical protein